MSSITIGQLFYDAYRDAGLVRTEQTGLNPDQIAECQQTYNRMIDSWQLDGGMTSHVARLLFDINPGQGDYTLGPGGDWDPGQGIAGSGVAGQIPSNYPVRIERASMVLTTQEYGGAGPPEYPIFPLTIDEWQNWTLKGQKNNWPRRYFYEPAFQNGPNAPTLAIFHLLYVPTDANQCALYIEQTLDQIDATADAIVSFRPGYYDAISTNLAVRLAARTPGAQVSVFVQELARSSMSLIKMNNNRPLSKINDMVGANRWRSSIYMGNRYNQINNLRGILKVQHSADVMLSLGHTPRAKSFRAECRELFLN